VIVDLFEEMFTNLLFLSLRAENWLLFTLRNSCSVSVLLFWCERVDLSRGRCPRSNFHIFWLR
jgi:hypothetical protein